MKQSNSAVRIVALPPGEAPLWVTGGLLVGSSKWFAGCNHARIGGHLCLVSVAGGTNPESPNAHLLTGQDPGLSQGAGVARVVAVVSVEAGPSAPFAMAETCQR